MRVRDNGSDIFMKPTELVHCTDVDGKFIFVNNAWKKVFSYSDEELKSLSFFDLVHPSAKDSILAIHNAATTGKQVHNTEFTLITGNGRHIDVTGEVKGYSDSQGKLLCLVWTCKKVEQPGHQPGDLKQSEAMYQVLIENMGEVIWTMNLNLETTYISPSCTSMFGFTPAERLEKPVSGIITPDSLTRVMEKFYEEQQRERRGLNKPDRMVTIEVEYYRKNGSTVWAETTVRTLRAPNGEIIGYQGVCRDITERKESERLLKESELKQKRLAEHYSCLSGAALALAEADKVGVIIEQIAIYLQELTGAVASSVALYDQAKNELALKYIKMDPESVAMVESITGNLYSTMKWQLDDAQKNDMLKRIINRPGSLNELCMGILPEHVSDNLQKIVNFDSMVALTLHHGEKIFGSAVAYLSKTHLEISEDILKTFAYMAGMALSRGQFLEELMVAREEAEAASMSKTQFLANMSHEIRTPMNVVIGISTLLYNNEKVAEKKKYLAMVKDSAASLMSLLDDILDISIIEAGKFQLAPVRFNLSEQVERLVGMMAFVAEQKGLGLQCHIDHRLPRELFGDKTRINQVLSNLIVNAIKNTREGEILVEISTFEEAAGEMADEGIRKVHFSVSDTGVGIEKNKINRLFENFTQLDGGNPYLQEGAGLGLPICKNLVEIMGGWIDVESKPGEGSKFHFTIPMMLPGALKDRTKPTDLRRCMKLPQGYSLQVLLVEDNPFHQELAVAMLTAMGHRVTTASSGKDAMVLYRNQNFDAILMDINMAEMDGLEVTSRIRKLEKEHYLKRTPVIVVTAYAMRGEQEKILSQDVDGYITKPIVEATLEDALVRSVGPADAVALFDFLQGDKKLANQFFNDCRKKMESLKKLFNNNDVSPIAMIIDQLANDFINAGAMNASRQLAELRIYLASGRIDLLKNKLEELTATTEELIHFLKL